MFQDLSQHEPSRQVRGSSLITNVDGDGRADDVDVNGWWSIPADTVA